MFRLHLLLGALLLAAPVFSQEDGTAWLQFRLDETPQQVAKAMGPPVSVGQIGDLETWRYQIGLEDHHDFSHELVFRISTGRLISVTHHLEPERVVDDLFPPAETSVQHYPDAKHPQFSARLRKLEGGRWLLAMGSSGPGKPAAKLLLIRESEAPNFVEWVDVEE